MVKQKQEVPASENPKAWWSWTPCSVSHRRANDGWGNYVVSPAHSNYYCANGEFRANTLTNRFHRMGMGNWIRLDENSKSVIYKSQGADDYYFEFGTCKPYYD